MSPPYEYHYAMDDTEGVCDLYNDDDDDDDDNDISSIPCV